MSCFVESEPESMYFVTQVLWFILLPGKCYLFKSILYICVTLISEREHAPNGRNKEMNTMAVYTPF